MVLSNALLPADAKPKRTRVGVKQSKDGCFTCKCAFGAQIGWLLADSLLPGHVALSVTKKNPFVSVAVAQIGFVKAIELSQQVTSEAQRRHLMRTLLRSPNREKAAYLLGSRSMTASGERQSRTASHS
jgi:hypothetical protein